MKAKKRSRTAEMAAVIRALHLAYESPVVFNDPFASRLAGPVWHVLCRSRLLYLLATRTIYKSLNPIRRQILARARYAEDQLEKALRSGIKQYAIIGAGLDSFALRRADFAGKINVYELDHPATQEAKKLRLKNLDISLPENHSFVPIDFEKENIADASKKSSFKREDPVFFSWLGTVYYISEPAVLRTLKSIKQVALSGSELVFDYAAHDSHDSHSDKKTVRNLKKYTQRRGEPIVSTFDPQRFPLQVERLGYLMLENLSPQEQAERYFSDGGGQEVTMPGSYFAHFRIN